MNTSGIVAAEVLAVRNHPNADKIWLADVDLGDGEPRQVVFGGHLRLRAGDRVVAAPPGARLPTGVKMRRRRYRGETSYGMLCSVAEVGWARTGPDEVAILRQDLAPGTCLDTGYGSADVLRRAEVEAQRKLPRIVFLRGGTGTIDRSWEHVDAMAALRRLGYPVSYHAISETGFTQLASQAKQERVLVWPTSYTIEADPRGRQITEELATWGVPHVGASALVTRATSKILLAEMLNDLGLPTPRSFPVTVGALGSPAGYSQALADLRSQGLAYPVVVKSEYSTGSIGVSVAHDGDQLQAALALMADYGQAVLVQEWARAREFTCAVLGRGPDALIAPLEIVLDGPHTILDDQIKKTYQGLQLKSVDGRLGELLRERVSAIWTAWDGGDYARIDVLQDAAGQLHVVDVNARPAMDDGPTVVSFYPQAMRHTFGLSYDDCVQGVAATALARRGAPLPPPLARVAQRLGAAARPARSPWPGRCDGGVAAPDDDAAAPGQRPETRAVSTLPLRQDRRGETVTRPAPSHA